MLITGLIILKAKGVSLVLDEASLAVMATSFVNLLFACLGFLVVFFF